MENYMSTQAQYALGLKTAERLPLFIDWLAVSLILPTDEVRPIRGTSIVEQTPTNVWNKRALIINEVGDKILTALWCPKSSIINKNSLLLEVANEWLYHGRGPISLVNEFCAVNGAHIVGVSRVDLATDFELNEERRAVVWGLADGSMYVSGKRNGSSFWSVSNDERLPEWTRGEKIPHCQSWGHKTSAVKWKLYYKWKELCDAAGTKGYDKTYIVGIWEELGFDVRSVWRLEVSLRYCSGLKRGSERISFEILDKHAIEIFRSLYSLRFCVRKNEGHKDKTNDTIIPFLPPMDFYAAVRTAVPSGDHPRNGATKLLRNLIRSLDDMPVLVDEKLREGVIWQIDNVCRTQHLYPYACAVIGGDLWEWLEQKRVEASRYVCD